MALYKILKPGPAGARVAEALIVAANSAAQAARMADAYSENDGGGWNSSDATALSDASALSVAGVLNGWRFRIVLVDPTAVDPVTGASGVIVDVEVTGGAMDTMGTALAVALNATTPIAGAAYTAGSQSLKVAETTDGLGDSQVYVYVRPPSSNEGADRVRESMASEFVSSITDEGSAGAALTVVFVADTVLVPVIREAFRKA